MKKESERKIKDKLRRKEKENNEKRIQKGKER